MIQLVSNSLCSTGEAGSSLTYACAHEIYTDFSMHEKNKTESIITKHGSIVHCMYRRNSSTALVQACLSLSSAVSVGRRSLLQTLQLGDWTPTLRQSPQRDKTFMPRIRSKGKGYTCSVGVSRNFRACAYVRCAPARLVSISCRTSSRAAAKKRSGDYSARPDDVSVWNVG